MYVKELKKEKKIQETDSGTGNFMGGSTSNASNPFHTTNSNKVYESDWTKQGQESKQRELPVRDYDVEHNFSKKNGT